MKPFKFNMSSPVYDDLFVDREKELRQTIDWLMSGTGNLIITGERGIGKTSLAWKTIADTEEKTKDTLIIRETVYQFHGEGFGTFLSELGKQITVSIWQLISGKSFSELFSGSLDFEKKKIESKNIKALRRIYNILSASQLSSKATEMGKIGGKLFIEAGLQEGLEKGMTRMAITNFEFLAIIDELKEIASRHGYSRIVVIADEFNYLHFSEQSDFVRTYFQILNSRNILFGLIGFNIDPWSVPGLSQCVETYIPLGPFESSDHVRQLVSVGLPQAENADIRNFLISEDVSQQIFTESKGNPRLIQAFCFNFMRELEVIEGSRDFSKAFELAKREIVEQVLRQEEMMKRFKG
ncbi:MAG: hypothetical protein AB1422_09680 [bacterium]